MKRLFAIALVLVLLFTASAIAEPFRVGHGMRLRAV